MTEKYNIPNIIRKYPYCFQVDDNKEYLSDKVLVATTKITKEIRKEIKMYLQLLGLFPDLIKAANQVYSIKNADKLTNTNCDINICQVAKNLDFESDNVKCLETYAFLNEKMQYVDSNLPQTLAWKRELIVINVTLYIY